MRRVLIALTTTLLAATTTLAHPGHGQTPATAPSHLLAEPIHLGPLLVLLSGLVAGALLAWRRRHPER